jgi:hypothetical protein
MAMCGGAWDTRPWRSVFEQEVTEGTELAGCWLLDAGCLMFRISVSSVASCSDSFISCVGLLNLGCADGIACESSRFLYVCPVCVLNSVQKSRRARWERFVSRRGAEDAERRLIESY